MMPRALEAEWAPLPINEDWGVGHALLLPTLDPTINGKAFFVAGQQIVDIEDKLQESQPVWLGEQLSQDVNAGQAKLLAFAMGPQHHQ